MALRDILVHADGTPEGLASLEMATALARQHDSHLTALYVRDTMLALPGSGSLGYTNWQLVEALMQQLDEALVKGATMAREQFEACLQREGISGEWRQAEGVTAEVVPLHARYSDLCIIRQPRPETPADASYLDLAETTLFGAGRPVLIDSFATQPGRPFDNVLIAWSGTREATRGVHDAMAILQAAKSVTVLAVNPGRGINGDGEVPAEDMAAHLARHGVTATAMHTVAVDIDIGNVLLNGISDVGADLLVMGAYGHSRAREMMLGGATRTVLRHMTVPVLMSH
jgi:nucleotide-binding universal stress UspA family protein